MLSPWVQQPEPFLFDFDVFMSDAEALASLSDELCGMSAADLPLQLAASVAELSSCGDQTVPLFPALKAASLGSGAANEAPSPRTQSQVACTVPTSGSSFFPTMTPPSPAIACSSGGSTGCRDSLADLDSAESEGSVSTTPTPTSATSGDGFWDHELLHPRVLGRHESAAYRRQRAARREQRRLAQQRDAFDKLQEALPGNTSRMSRLDLLRLAIQHIQELNVALSETESASGDEREAERARPQAKRAKARRGSGSGGSKRDYFDLASDL